MGTGDFKLLVSVLTCKKHADRRKACEATWLPRFKHKQYYSGLSGFDAYEYNNMKTIKMMYDAMRTDVTHVLKCDDDSYIHYDRLMAAKPWEQGDAVGQVWFMSWDSDARGRLNRSVFVDMPTLAGGAGWIANRKAMEVLAKGYVKRNGEDRNNAQLWHDAGIELTNDDRFSQNLHRFPNHDNDLITSHHLNPRLMNKLHRLQTHAN